MTLLALLVFGLFGCAQLPADGPIPDAPLKKKVEVRMCVVTALQQMGPNTYATVQMCEEPDVIEYDPAGAYPQPVPEPVEPPAPQRQRHEMPLREPVRPSYSEHVGPGSRPIPPHREAW